MSTAKRKPALAPALNNPLPLETFPGESDARAKARAMVRPSINAAMVIEAFDGNLLGKDTSLEGLIEALRDSMDRTKGGDLSTVEAMLVGQATALQTIFVSLARRAQVQQSQRNLEAFLGLALKAQAQSRATITALVDLKFPRQPATFVKQANIAAGNQQVNNGAASDANPEQDTPVRRHAGDSATAQNKLMEKKPGPPIQRMDARAAPPPERGHQTVETVEPIHRAAIGRRQAEG